MAGSGSAGKTLLLLLLLLGLLAGGGAYNYNRNLEKEAKVPRPWRGYADADIQSMADAYRAEVEQYSDAWEQARTRRTSAAGTGHVDARIREFDRVYAQGRKVRDLKSGLAEREVVLEQLDEELRLRESQADVWKLHLRRLTTFD
jgi:hypothetical protein